MIKGIYDKNARISEDIYLKLEDNHYSNYFKLLLVDKDGNGCSCGNLAEIDKKTGIIRLCGGVNSELGIKLTNGRVKVTLYTGVELT